MLQGGTGERRVCLSPSVRLQGWTELLLTSSCASARNSLRGVWGRAWQLLSPTLEVVAVYYRQRFCLLTLAEFGRILLDIDEPARGQLREKLRRIEREQYSLLENARAP